MRGIQVTILLLIAGAVGLGTGNRLLEVMAVGLTVLVAIGLAYRVLAVGEVQGQRTLSDAVVAWGQMLTQTIQIVNRARLTIPAIRVTDQSTLPESTGGFVARLPASRTITWEMDVPCRHRGRYQIGPLTAVMGDPLGLFPAQRVIGRRQSFLVLPRWVPLRRCALRLDGFTAGEVRGRYRGEAPPNVSSIREYEAGDPLASIHWPGVARTGQMLTKRYAPEVQSTLWVALDLDERVPEEIEELLVTVATSISMYGLQRANLRLGLLASGTVPIVQTAERGRPHQYRVQEALAEVHAGEGTKLSAQIMAIDQRLGPSNVVLLVTARLPDSANWISRLTSRGVAVRVIQVSPAVEMVPAENATGHGWGVPHIVLPPELTAPDQDARLIAALEGQGGR